MKKRANVTDIEKYKAKSKKGKMTESKSRPESGSRVQNARRRRVATRLKVSAALFIAVSIFMLMARYSVISKLNYETHSLGKELEETTNRKKELYYELEMKTNSAKIEKEAREKLGMDYPTDEQTVYINVQ